MATKSIIEIPVDDSEFRRFYELFEKFKDETAEMPETWRAIDEAMGSATSTATEGALNAREALAVAAAQAGVIAEALRGAVKAQSDLGSATHKTNTGMQGLQKSAEGVGRAISLVGGWIVKLGAIGGLGALFSGFGIGELANAAFSRSRSAGGLGISPGLLASFQVNAQQFGTTSDLTTAANTLMDIRNSPFLKFLGVKNAYSQDPANLYLNELRGAAQSYRQYEARGMAGFWSLSAQGQAAARLGIGTDAIRRAAMPGGLAALGTAQTRMNADVGVLELSPRVQAEWTQLKITLDKAGMSIQTTLIDDLTPLAPQLGHLADAVTSVLTGLLDNKSLPRFLDDVSTGLESLADFLDHVDWTKAAAFFDKLWPKDFNAVGTGGKHGLLNKNDWLSTPGMQAIENFFGSPAWKKASSGSGKFADSLLGQALGSVFGGVGSALSSAAAKAIVPIAGGFGVDPILALATAYHESGFNPNSHHMDHYANGAPAGYSSGLFQLNEHGEGAGLSLAQLLNPKENARIALSEMAKVARAHPDWSPGQIAAGAQRPAHPGQYAKEINSLYGQIAQKMIGSIISTVDSDIKKYGKDWSKHLPSDVAAFVAQAHLSKAQQSSTDIKSINKTLKAVLAKRTTPPKVNLHVTNPTASRHSVSLKAAIP